MSSAPQPMCQMVDVISDFGGVVTLVNSSHDFCTHTASSSPANFAFSLSNFEV
jgi:pyrroline-5-carboxylate reductase